MFAVTSPPLWQLDAAQAYWIAGGVGILAAAALVWGRLLSRFLVGATLAAGAWALGSYMAESMEWAVLPVQIGMAVLALLIGLVLAPVVWALVLAGLLAAGVAWILTLQYLPEWPGKEINDAFAGVGTFSDWVFAVGAAGWLTLRELFDSIPGPALIGMSSSGLLGILVGLLRPRLVKIVLTSLLGACGLVAAVVLAVVEFRPSVWEQFWRWWQVPLCLVAGLSILGMIIQYRQTLRADRDPDKREAEPPSKRRLNPEGQTVKA